MKNTLALLLITFALHAYAQQTCSTFDTGLGGWTEDETTCRNIGGSVECDDGSGGSNLVAPAAFHGNWVTRVNGCGSLCFDVNLIESGLDVPARLSIVITSGAHRATFRANPIAEGSGWQRFCAPIALTFDGAPPQSGDGAWVLAAGTDWNALIADVKSLELPIDLVTGNVERIGFDNVCFQEDCPPPISCDVPSFSVSHHMLTPVGADELQSDLLLHVPAPYERITVTLVSASVRSSGDCDYGTFPLAAHFVDPQTPAPPSTRELTRGPGSAPDVPILVRIRGTQVGFPAECVEELTLCFRYRVTGRDCVTCEDTSCQTVRRP